MQRASSRPPPRAVEEMALMLGMGREDRAVKVARRFVRKAVVLGRIGCGVSDGVSPRYIEMDQVEMGG